LGAVKYTNGLNQIKVVPYVQFMKGYAAKNLYTKSGLEGAVLGKELEFFQRAKNFEDNK
jgi:hypothetical protein